MRTVKNTYKYLPIRFLLLLFLLPLNAQAQSAESTPTPGTPEYLQRLCDRYEAAYQSGDKVDELAALDLYQAEAARQNNYKEESYARGSRICCFFNHSDYDRMFELLPGELEFLADHEDWDSYYHLLTLKIDAYILTNRYQTAMNESRAIYTEAKRTKNRLGIGVASYCMGCTYNFTERNHEAEAALREAIRSLSGEKDCIELLHLCYLKLTDVLQSLGKYKELLAHAAQMEKNIDPEKTIYIDQCFYTNHAYYWAYAGLGNISEAEPYYQKAHALSGNSESMIRSALNMRASMLSMKGQVKEAIAVIDSIMTYADVQDSETIRCQKLREKVSLLDRIGQYETSTKLKDEILSLQDSIYNRDLAKQIDELQTIYDVDHLRFENERQRLRMVIAAIACALLLILLGTLYQYHRTVQRKNEAIIARLRKLETVETQMKVAEAARPVETLSNDEQLFRQIERLLEDKTLLQLPKLGRDELAERLATNRTYIMNAIRNCTEEGSSTSEYINGQRVKYARHLLEFRPDLSIEAVSEMCGFTTRNGLYKAFRNKYDMAPTDFRKATLKQK